MGTDSTTDDIDPITLEVLWSRLRTIPKEMGTHLHRTGYSEVIKHALDFSTAVFTRDGQLVAQGVYTPGHLGSMPLSMKRILEEYYPPDAWRPGDLVLTNDPTINSGHLPDFFTFEPAFHDGELVGFCVTTGHQIDVGGSAPGSMTMHSDDVYEEGLQIPPVKLYEAGDLNEAVLAIIRENSREPDKIAGDVRAHHGASRVGVERNRELVAEYGQETVERYVDEILRRTESSMRESIRDVPDGEYAFDDRLDGFGDGDAIDLHATVTVAEDELTVDWAGSDAQRPDLAINSTLTYTTAHTMLAVKSAVDPDTPHTQGAIAPVTVTAPEGTVVNPRMPAPVGSRSVMCTRIVSTVNGAMHQALPNAVPAGGSEQFWAATKFDDPKTEQPRILQEGFYGGAGARSHRDGFPAVSGASNVQNTPVEVIESGYPLSISQYEIVADTSGDGTYRGGPGTVRTYEFEVPATVQFLNDRYEEGPYGLAGGERGTPGRATLNPGTPYERKLTSKEQVELSAGDVVEVRTPGGGGYGNPSDRSAEAVRDDVAQGKLTAEKARDVYGVE